MNTRNLDIHSNHDRKYGLDFIKIIATIIIVFHHYQLVMAVRFPSGINYCYGTFFFGRMVELFFIISGYLMYRYVDTIYTGRVSLKDWYLKRALRLLPLVAVSAVAFECIIYVHNSVCNAGGCHQKMAINLFGTLITGLGMQVGVAFENPMVNNPTWYISVLILVYVMFYLVTTLAGKLKAPAYYFYIFMVLLGCGIKRYNINSVFFNEDTYRGIYCFFTGLLLATYVNKFGVSNKLAACSSICALVIISILAIRPNLLDFGHEYVLSFLLFPSLVLLTETRLSKKLFRHRFWGLWGQISYGVYLWHSVLILSTLSLAHIMNIKPNYAQRPLMYLFCIGCEIVAVISHYCIEKPLDKYLKRKLKGIIGNN